MNVSEEDGEKWKNQSEKLSEKMFSLKSLVLTVDNEVCLSSKVGDRDKRRPLKAAEL
jgi:hypothetical protein